MNLPAVLTDTGLAIIEPTSGELVDLHDASDHALGHAAQKLADADRDLFALRRIVAHEFRARHGVGKVDAGGYSLTVTESQSWPAGAVTEALSNLLSDGQIGQGDYDRCMPSKPRPDPRALKSLLGRLLVSDPDAARVLAAAATISPPSVRDVKASAVDAREAA